MKFSNRVKYRSVKIPEQKNEYEEINTPEYCENNGVYDMIDADYKQELVNIYNNAISRGLTEEELVAIDDNFAYI